MKKHVVLLLVLVIVSSMFAFVACDNKEKSIEEIKLDLETDLTVDYEDVIGLYFYGEHVDDYKRSNLAKEDEDYFDPSKKTMIFFHGWKPGANGIFDGPCTDIRLSSENVSRNGGVMTSSNTVQYYKDLGYNVGAMDWSCYAGDLFSMYEQVWVSFDNGHSIICRFAKEYINFFDGYENEIEFTGHSFGAHTSTGTAYLLYKYAQMGMISYKSLPKRLSLADPYIGDACMIAMDEAAFKTMDNTKEYMNGRYPADTIGDCFEYMDKYGVAIDVYAAIPFNFDTIYTIPGSTYGDDVLATRRASALEKLQSHATWTVLKNFYNTYSMDAHNYTIDWMMVSKFSEIKEDGEDGFYPTLALSNEEIRKLKGKQFLADSTEFNVNSANFDEFIDWPVDGDWTNILGVEND